MIIHPTHLAGASLIDVERREDSRGHFARVYCEQEFQAQGLPVFDNNWGGNIGLRARCHMGLHH